MMNLLTESAASAGGGIALMVIYIVIIGAAMYFFAIRPQKKEQRRMTAMLSALEIGDTVVTTSGFYGVVIDITDEDCIVEFGSNKNCRIPMKRARSPRWRSRARHKCTGEECRELMSPGVFLFVRNKYSPCQINFPVSVFSRLLLFKTLPHEIAKIS